MAVSYGALRIRRIKDTHCFYFTTGCLSFIGVLPGRYCCMEVLQGLRTARQAKEITVWIVTVLNAENFI